ncbi:MAG: hypothetical protein ACPGCP_06745 [Candidatus Nanopelagicales bacterium]
MTTPGEQLDRNSDQIAKNFAKLQTHAEAIAELYAEIAKINKKIDAGDCDTVDIDPPVQPGQGFTDLGQPDHVVTVGASPSDLQHALDNHEHVGIEAGVVFQLGRTLKINRPAQTISVVGEGERPVLYAAKDCHGIDIAARQAVVKLQGIAVYGPYLSDRVGIRYRLPSNKDGGLNILIEDCDIARFDSLIELVDDRSRSKPVPGAEGRISALIRRNILRDAWTSGSHSAGIYTEGVKLATAEGNVTQRIGYTEDGADPREKRSHGWYAQQFGGRIVSRGNWWADCSANSIQARLGGDVTDNIAIRCGVNFTNGSNGPESSYIRNLVLDQVDISPYEHRGDAFPVSGSGHTIKDNLAVRKLGSATNRTAYRDYWDAKEFSNNGSIGWVPGGDGSANWSLDEVPDDFPEFTDDLLDTLLNRPRGVWGDEYETKTFIDAAWAAIPN